MKRAATGILLAACFALAAAAMAAAAQKDAGPAWKDCLRQKPEWYAGDEAVRIADNVLLYQRDSGGWPKNTEMAAILSDKEKADLTAQKSQPDSTIDNGSTYAQIAYLAKVYEAARKDRHKDAGLKGIDYLLKAQYPNGSWPQFYPRAKDYYAHITFNDDAMVGVLRLLDNVARKEPPYGFVDEPRRAAAEKAVAKGIDCILKCQIVGGGKRTAWCAQHDEKTLLPAKARAYEHPSVSGGESLGVVRFLMSLDKPSPEVIEAVQSAVAWFNEVKLTGIRQTEKDDPSVPGGKDKVIVPDPAAPPLWARFYEIGTNRPIFSGRDGVIKYSLAEIEHERRTGYAWYVSSPAGLLTKDYPAWQTKWAPGRNVLGK